MRRKHPSMAQIDHLKVTVISAERWTIGTMLGEFFAHGELLYFLLRRTYKIRYAQAALGIAWAILQPLLTALILAAVLGRVMRPSTQGVPPLLFFFAGTVPWTFFANGVSSAATSLSSNLSLVQKVYFPRLCLPVAAVLSAGVDLIVPLLFLFAAMIFYGRFDPSLATLPMFLALLVLELMTAVGIGAGLAALNLKYRDVQHALPFALQILFFASPIVYASTSLEEPWKTLYFLNPMAGILETMRATLLNTQPVSWTHLLLSSLSVVAVFLGGLFYFYRAEGQFADVA